MIHPYGYHFITHKIKTSVFTKTCGKHHLRAEITSRKVISLFLYMLGLDGSGSYHIMKQIQSSLNVSPLKLLFPFFKKLISQLSMIVLLFLRSG